MEYTLKNEFLTVGFKALGGSLHSIKDKEGTEYLWQGDAKYWSGQAPVLFPICGSLRNNRAAIGNGKTTEMPRHGIVRKREFACEKMGAGSILFSIESNEEMLRQFPYRFRLSICYRLEENSITTEYTVTNLDTEEMPFFIGGHPGFCCPLYEGESYEDYKLVFEKEEHTAVPTSVAETGLIDMGRRTVFLEGQKELGISHGMFAQDAVVLDQLQSRSVTLCSRNHGKGIQVAFQDFPYLVLWPAPNQGPFLAIEPWAGLSTCSDESDVFEEKRNLQKAGPGESKKYSFTITIL